MAKIQFLTILLVVTFFLGGVVSVTDKEFKDLSLRFDHLAGMFQEQQLINRQLKHENQDLWNRIDLQSKVDQELREKITNLEEENIWIKQEIKGGGEPILTNGENVLASHDNDEYISLNNTIEERVTLLEIQVAQLEDDVTGLGVGLTEVDENVDFLFEEQVIQDERLFSLEQGTDEINAQLITINGDINSLQGTTLALDFRVTVLEENGGDGGNSSVAELEVRVEALEVTATDHETRISATETEIKDLEEAVVDQETRLIAAEENIQGLQMTDVDFETRITALEEDSGTNPENGTIAFHAALTTYSSIPMDRAVPFNEVLLNEGDGYDSSPGNEYGYFNIEINGEMLCTALGDTQDLSVIEIHTACNAAAFAVEGDMVQAVYKAGSDTTPLWEATSYYLHGFTGFRI